MRGLPSIVLGLLGVCILVTVAGCGSGGPESLAADPGIENSGGTGNLHFAVRFPPREEVDPQSLPVATDSVSIAVYTTVPYTLVDSACIERPPPNGGGDPLSTTFEEVPAGQVEIDVHAYESINCTGTTIAHCQALAQVVAAQTTTVTMVTDPLVIVGIGTPTAPEIGEAGSLPVTTEWFDADGNPMIPDSVAWSSDDTNVATVTPDGGDDRLATITGVAVGTCQVTAEASPTGAPAVAQVSPRTIVPAQVIFGVTVVDSGDLEVIVE